MQHTKKSSYKSLDQLVMLLLTQQLCENDLVSPISGLLYSAVTSTDQKRKKKKLHLSASI